MNPGGQDSTPHPEARRPRLSIADCPICARLPHKARRDRQRDTGESIPPEVDRLETVVEVTDGETHAYASSVSRLLRCPECGTYYYWNHYKDDGEHFMDPTYDEITFRRYGPLAAKAFLEGVADGSPNALPVAGGQWCKAFSEGSSLPDTRPADGGTGARAREALAALEATIDGAFRALVALLDRDPVSRLFMAHVVESLVHDFVFRGDWVSLRTVLLAHRDPAVRVAAAEHVLGVGTGDAAPADLLHMPAKTRHALAAEVAKPERMAELVEVLLAAALEAGPTPSARASPDFEGRLARGVRALALYGLVVAVGHKTNLLHAVPALLGLLSGDARGDRDVCWLLREIGGGKKGALAVLQGIDGVRDALPAKALEGKEFQELVAQCRTKARERGAPGAGRGKGTGKGKSGPRQKRQAAKRGKGAGKAKGRPRKDA